MVARLWSHWGAALLALIILFSVEISVVSTLRYLTQGQPAPEPILANAFANPWLAIHVAGGIVALLVSPFQFVRRIRERWPAVHRITGRIYVAAGLAAAPAGFMLALGTVAGPVAAIGFAVPALLWPLFTFAAVRAAVRREFVEHRAWMLRSYAIIANAITLRLMLPASMFLGFEFFTAYPIIAWAGWMTNLALVELYLRRGRRQTTPEGELATA